MKIRKNFSIIFAAVMILSLVLAGSAAAKTAGKVDVCHRTGNGTFRLINISSAALPDHLSHGDVAPGGAVAGQPGMVLAADCSLTSTTQNGQVQTLTVPSTTNNGKKATKVDVCHRTGNGTFILINISRNALPAHLQHGDGLPNEAIPNQTGKFLTNTCAISEVPQKELVQTLTILPTGASFVSQPLLAGQAYELIASGTFTYNPALNWADAEYYLKNSVVVKGDTEGSTPNVLDLSINGPLVNTDWGSYQSTHTYTLPWTGNGDPLSFAVYDSNYLDNVGSLTVEIWKINW